MNPKLFISPSMKASKLVKTTGELSRIKDKTQDPEATTRKRIRMAD